jgi:hypothetical protein
MTIIRKATGQVVDRHIRADMLDTVLNCLPFGVYDIEDVHGQYIFTAVVKRNSVKCEIIR